jgi:hypothetical protein
MVYGKGKGFPVTCYADTEGEKMIALLILDLGDRWLRVVSETFGPLNSRERVTVPILQEAGWAPGSV